MLRRITHGENGTVIFDDKIEENMDFQQEIHKNFEPMQHVPETHLGYMPESTDSIKVKKSKVETP